MNNSISLLCNAVATAGVVAGVCALLLCKYPFLTPNQIKSVLMRSAIKVCEEPNACGSGIINAFNAYEYINYWNSN